MGKSSVHVVLCECDHHDSGSISETAELLSAQGIQNRIVKDFCKYEVFSEFVSDIENSGTRSLIIVGCGRELAGEFLETVLKERMPGLDVSWIKVSGDNDPVSLSAGVLACYNSVSDSRSTKKRKSGKTDPSEKVLIVGGGVGGCQAALDLADGGQEVILVEKTLSLGGNMAKLDKTFPTLDCSICILGPRLVEVANHPNIELLTPAELRKVSGVPGKYKVEIALWPRFVDMTKCSGCGKCAEVCPIVIPSDWNLDLKPVKAIHINFEQAVPLRSAISKEFCVECRLCEKVCERDAICLDDKPARKDLHVKAIIFATGASPYSPISYGAYGYGYIPAVITNIEFERLVCATGPTGGRLITPEGAPARTIAFIQCVGSRNERYNSYCSGYCCTASIKEAILALEHEPQGHVTIFYNDVRTAGKGFEELYQRAIEKGVRFVKGIPSFIEEDPCTRQPIIHFYDMKKGERGKLAVDLAVLAVGLVPGKANINWELATWPKIDEFGFYRERERSLHSLKSNLDGVFFLGTCHGPRDITQTVSEASGVASEVQSFLVKLRRLV